jgi:hypothetical protein
MILDYFTVTGTVPPCPEQMDMNGDCVISWSDYLLLLHCFDTPIPCDPVETCCDPVLNSSCCVGHVGDVNGIDGDYPTIGDLSAIIDAKFISGSCEGIIACLAEADINRSGGCNLSCEDITIGDIALFIYIAFAGLPPIDELNPFPECLVCPEEK